MSLALMPSSLNLKWEGASSAFTITGESSTDWTCRSNCSWCRVSKTGNFTVGVTVERNTGASRTATVTVVCNSGTVSAKVYQRAYEVTYDRLSMIKPYHQPPDECAATCAAMCVKISPQELENMGCNMANADWSCIARKSGYTIYPSGGVAAGTLQNAYDGLKSGYPVIVKVNNSDDHWVVITGFSGNPSNLLAENFTCVDPNTVDESLPAASNTVQLNKCTNYNAVCKYIIYKKK